MARVRGRPSPWDGQWAFAALDASDDALRESSADVVRAAAAPFRGDVEKWAAHVRACRLQDVARAALILARLSAPQDEPAAGARYTPAAVQSAE